ncbi:MAG: hypothetical protein H0U68_23680 [Ramlibacter sp.]|nr:hypothetical protein [Ramlibacter sp.]
MASLRITSGPYAGGFVIAPNGKFNWYFAQLGLLPIVQYLSATNLETYIRPYLDLYLRSVNADYSIDDVEFPMGSYDYNNYRRVLSDSDDSYAATLLSLVARYLHASNNWAWWEANKAKLKTIAYRNIAMAVKPNGLTSVFQPGRNSANSIGYLMDNCEAYRGLRDFAGLLRERGDGDSAYYDNFATGIGNALARLFQSTSAGFTPGDAYTSTLNIFYPGTTCQVFVQGFGVSECAPLFDSAWKYLNNYSPSWEDGRYDAYAWGVLGYVAAKRGMYTQAKAQMATIERQFAANRAMVTINELGFYQRTRSVLAGAADV